MHANNMWAKSDGTLLHAHLKHVASLAEALAKGFKINAELAYKAGILHDIGKAHPHFQAILKGGPPQWKNKQIPFRHEYASLLFLPVFNSELWPQLTELIVSHHKGLDQLGKGLYKLCEDEGEDCIIYHYLNDFESWSSNGYAVLAQLNIQAPQNLTLEDAKKALRFSIEQARALYNTVPRVLSTYRGLLMAADHMASALEEGGDFSIPPLFGIPDLSKFDRQSPSFPLSQKPANDSRPHTLVVAPTGAGKTDYLMRRCRGRVFYTLPFQASIDAMHARMESFVPMHDAVRIHRLHGASQLMASNKKEEDSAENVILQPFAGASIKVLTPFQMAGIALGTAGFEALAIDIAGQDVILDEIHTYQKIGQAIVHGIVRGLVQLGCRVHIGTATIPTALYQNLLAMLGGTENTLEVSLSPEELTTYNRHKIFKHETDTSVVDIVRPYFKPGLTTKVLLVANTVGQAQAWVEQLSAAFPEIDKPEQFLLLHSRFKRADRHAREQRLQNEFETGPLPCLCIATQVVEVSLDISFDVLITQAAPIDSLVQRLGRVNRRRSKQTNLADVHVLSPKTNTLPYDKDVVNTSFNVLPADGQMLDTNSLQRMIDAVYPTFNPTRIEANLAWAPDGTFKLRPLCHSTKSLLEMLEIDTVPAILQEDEQAYQQAGKDWMARRMLEIPVPRTSIAYRNLRHLHGVGGEPYVVPQNQADYQRYGLRFNLTTEQMDPNFL